METEFFRFFELFPGTAEYERYLEFRYAVFCEELKRVDATCGKSSAHGLPMETDRYDAFSRHFSAVHKASGEMAACARVILPSPMGLNVSERYIIDRDLIDGIAEDQLGEISRMAISHRFRRRRDDADASAAGNPKEELSFTTVGKRRHQPELVLGMYREIFLLCARLGVEFCYAALDQRFSRLLQSIGFPFKAVGPINPDVLPPRRVFIIGSHDIEINLSRRDHRILRFLSGAERSPQ